MQTEFEARFLNIDHRGMRSNLVDIGARCTQQARPMRRAMLDFPDRRYKKAERPAMVRVRDEGNKCTFAFKRTDARDIAGMKESEVQVMSFDKAIGVLLAMGLEVISLQESRREDWTTKDGLCWVSLDEWPWLDEFIEIEGRSAKGVQQVAEQLGLEWKSAVFGDVMSAYRAQYPHLGPRDTILDLPQVRFDMPLPPMLQAK